MLNLETTHPDFYELFEKGYHTIRHSDRLWAGLSPDLVIAQVLMQSIKTVGGLTRGKGMNDLQLAIRLLSMPAVAEVNRAMQEFTEVMYAASDQHKEVSNSRIEKDHSDSVKVAEYFLERFPFGQGRELINIDNGEVADSSTNVYESAEVGKRMTKEIVSRSVFDYSFKKKDSVFMVSSKSMMTVDNERLVSILNCFSNA